MLICLNTRTINSIETGAATSYAVPMIAPTYFSKRPIPNPAVITAGKFPNPAAVTIAKDLTEYVIPFIKKTQLNNKDEIMAVLEAHDIRKIDSAFIKVESEKRVKEDVKQALLQGELPVDLGIEQTEETIQAELSEQGNVRSFKPSDITSKEWKDYFKDMEWELEIDVTGEGKNIQEAMTTINTILQITAANPQALEDPRFKLLLNKALNLTGAVSPMELSQLDSAQAPTPPPAPEGTPAEAPVATI